MKCTAIEGRTKRWFLSGSATNLDIVARVQSTDLPILNGHILWVRLDHRLHHFLCTVGQCTHPASVLVSDTRCEVKPHTQTQQAASNFSWGHTFAMAVSREMKSRSGTKPRVFFDSRAHAHAVASTSHLNSDSDVSHLGTVKCNQNKDEPAPKASWLPVPN